MSKAAYWMHLIQYPYRSLHENSITPCRRKTQMQLLSCTITSHKPTTHYAIQLSISNTIFFIFIFILIFNLLQAQISILTWFSFYMQNQDPVVYFDHEAEAVNILSSCQLYHLFSYFAYLKDGSVCIDLSHLWVCLIHTPVARFLVNQARE